MDHQCASLDIDQALFLEMYMFNGFIYELKQRLVKLFEFKEHKPFLTFAISHSVAQNTTLGNLRENNC